MLPQSVGDQHDGVLPARLTRRAAPRTVPHMLRVRLPWSLPALSVLLGCAPSVGGTPDDSAGAGPDVAIGGTLDGEEGFDSRAAAIFACPSAAGGWSAGGVVLSTDKCAGSEECELAGDGDDSGGICEVLWAIAVQLEDDRCESYQQSDARVTLSVNFPAFGSLGDLAGLEAVVSRGDCSALDCDHGPTSDYSEPGAAVAGTPADGVVSLDIELPGAAGTLFAEFCSYDAPPSESR